MTPSHRIGQFGSFGNWRSTDEAYIVVVPFRMGDSEMDRRSFLDAVVALGFALSNNAASQPRKIPLVGFLRTDRPPQSYVDAFEQGLRERGYTPRQDDFYRLPFCRWHRRR